MSFGMCHLSCVKLPPYPNQYSKIGSPKSTPHFYICVLVAGYLLECCPCQEPLPVVCLPCAEPVTFVPCDGYKTWEDADKLHIMAHYPDSGEEWCILKVMFPKQWFHMHPGAGGNDRGVQIESEVPERASWIVPET